MIPLKSSACGRRPCYHASTLEIRSHGDITPLKVLTGKHMKVLLIKDTYVPNRAASIPKWSV